MIVIDLFAGGGGASEGIRRALGVGPILAINHNPAAVAMHAANHPDTEHACEDVYRYRPPSRLRNRVDLLWASPDCTHFSRARGAAPRSPRVRGLAWMVTEWASAVRPRVIAMENVEEFTTWGPLDDNGQPIKASAGETFRQWVASLELLGYRVEWRSLRACDFGAPTIRKRLFVVARCDGAPIAWPEPTHGPGRPLPWRTAAECIDWSIPCPSIFDRPRPLAEATCRRIAEGIRRYVLNGKPFLVCLTHGGRLEPVDEPMRTITTAHRGERALVAPTLIANNSNNAPHAVTAPLGTVTTGSRHYEVAAFLARHNGTTPGHMAFGSSLDRPLGTVTAVDTHGLAVAYIARHNGGAVGRELDAPVNTVVAAGSTMGPVAVFLDKLHGSARAGVPVDGPAPTITSGGDRGGGHAALVAAFLLRYYGSGGQWGELSEPMHTIVSKARFGLVTVPIEGEEYVLADIGLRMLQPRELATAQGFGPDYILTGSKAEQIARIGNSVCPPAAEAIVRANLRAGSVAVAR